MNSFYSTNNRFIVEPYKKEAIRSNEKSGFAFIDQKIKLKGLKVLIDAQLIVNGVAILVKKGSVVYVKEESLHTQQWAQKYMECDSINERFLIIDFSQVECIDSLE